MQDLDTSNFGRFVQEILDEALKFKVYVTDRVSCTCTQCRLMQNGLETIASTYGQMIPNYAKTISTTSSDIPLILINGFRYRQPAPEIDAAVIFPEALDLQENLVSALRAFTKGITYTRYIDLAFVKKDKQISKEEYYIKLDSGEGGKVVYSGNKRLLRPRDCIRTSDFLKQIGGFIYDAPYSFVLYYQDMPVAVLSFEAQLDAILVVQIQGARGMQHALAPLKWERLLLNTACKWAAENKISEAKVLPYHRNEWEKVQKDGKLRYNVTAERSRFKYDQSEEVYKKRLDSILVNC